MAVAYSNARPGAIVGYVRAGAELVRRIGPAWLVLLASIILSLLGVYSINISTGLSTAGVGLTAGAAAAPEAAALTSTASRQLIYLAIGVLAAVVIAVPHYRYLGHASWVFMGIAILLLVFLLIPFVPTSIVRPRNGARGWIDLGVVDFQPAEVAKIAYVLVLAWYLRFRANHRTFRGLIPPAIITFIPVGLITLQPDLGTACLFIPVLFAVLVAAGAKLKHLIIIVACAMLAAPAAYPLLKPHQRARIVGLMQQIHGDTRDDQGINMQSVTAQRLIGAGGVAGTNQEHSRTLLRYNALPFPHTDMIYAVIVNRFGALGGVVVLGLYAVWGVGALLTAALCREPFGRLVVVGLAGFLAAQVFVNVGMNLGLLPIIGITLPYLSHGGSSMLTVWLMTGLIVSVAIHRPKVSLRRSFEYADDE